MFYSKHQLISFVLMCADGFGCVDDLLKQIIWGPQASTSMSATHCYAEATDGSFILFDLVKCPLPFSRLHSLT